MNNVTIPLETSMRYLGMFYDESGHKLHQYRLRRV